MDLDLRIMQLYFINRYYKFELVFLVRCLIDCYYYLFMLEIVSGIEIYFFIIGFYRF